MTKVRTTIELEQDLVEAIIDRFGLRTATTSHR
jgi:hypothetical protein